MAGDRKDKRLLRQIIAHDFPLQKNLRNENDSSIDTRKTVHPPNQTIHHFHPRGITGFSPLPHAD